MWTYLIAGMGFAFAAAVQPGPFQAFVVSRTLEQGWRRTLPAALAPLVSDAPILLVCLLVLTRIPPHLVRVLHLAGAAFLFFLAWRAWLSWRAADADPPAPATASGTLVQAALVNFLNPNPWLGWSLVMGPLFLEGYAEAPGRGVALIVGFYATMVACQAALIGIVGWAGRLGPGLVRRTRAVAVLALAAFGVLQLWLGLRGPSG